MCTVTWIFHECGYTLLSSRDEKLTRPASLAPMVQEREGIQFVAPVDTAFGGTWIACNDAGVSLCLLNGPAGAPKPYSRGRLLMGAVGARSQAEVAKRVQSQDLSQFSSFTLIALAPAMPVLMLSWDGTMLTQAANAEAPLASSSFDFDGVRQMRRSQFANIGHLNVEVLRSFHSSHENGPGPYSPCMHRRDAQTVSLTEVHVGRDIVKMIYNAGSPCEGGPVRSFDFTLRS